MILTETQGAIRDAVRDFAQEQIRPRSAEFEACGGYPAELFVELASLGLMGMTVRETVSVQTFFIAARLAELEKGIAVIDEFTARALRSPGFRYLPLDPPLKFGIASVTLESNPPGQAARQFLRILDTTLEDHRKQA